MRNPPPPLAPDLEALLAPHRHVLPLAPFVEARAIARATAAERWSRARTSGWPRWAFALAAGVALTLGAGAYAARVWVAAPSLLYRIAPIAPPRTAASKPQAVVWPPPASDAPVPVHVSVAAPVVPRAVRVVAKTSPVTARPSNEELQLLRAAREDAARGAFARALGVLSEHTRRFRNGALVEEREALRVKSLAGLGRQDEAQSAAAQFHARFPHSVFLSTFERIKEPGR